MDGMELLAELEDDIKKKLHYSAMGNAGLYQYQTGHRRIAMVK